MRVTNPTSWILSLTAVSLVGCATGHDGDVNIGSGQSPDKPRTAREKIE